MLIQRAYKTEIDPNNVQKTLLRKHAGSARFAWNWALARIKDKTSKPNAITLHRELNALKPIDFPWMYEVSKCAPQEALRNLQTAFGNFFKANKSGKKAGIVPRIQVSDAIQTGMGRRYGCSSRPILSVEQDLF
jgi:putative transposase